MTKNQRLGHRPGLDGVRGLAVLAVVAAHAGVPGTSLGGIIGVEVFFVLSGFLITNLLLDECERHGGVNLPAFYLRRARRLLPALVVLLAVVGVVAVVVGDEASVRGVVWSGLYGANIPRMTGTDLGVLGHLWSLAIEEHFYIVWPAVVALLMRTTRARTVAWVALGGAVVLVLHRQGFTDYFRIYNGTDTRAAGILLGAGMAAPWRTGRIHVPRTLGWVAAGVLALTVAAVGPITDLKLGPALVAIDLAAVVLVLAAVELHRCPLVLAWFGGISYALYLWHNPISEWVGKGGARGLLGAGLAVVAAVLSGRLVEARWRQGNRDSGNDVRAMSDVPSAFVVEYQQSRSVPSTTPQAR